MTFLSSNLTCPATQSGFCARLSRSWALRAAPFALTGKAAGAAPIHFRPRHTGPATPGQVRSARAAAGLTDRRARAQQEGVSNEDASLVAVAILAMVIVPPALAKAKRAQSARPQQGYQSSERPGYYHGYPLSDWYRDSLSSY